MKIDSQENVLRHFLFGSRKNPYLTFQGKVFGLNLPTTPPPPLPHQGNSSLVSEFPLKDCSFNHFSPPVPPPPTPTCTFPPHHPWNHTLRKVWHACLLPIAGNFLSSCTVIGWLKHNFSGHDVCLCWLQFAILRWRSHPFLFISQGKPFTSIEPSIDINDMCLYPDSGKKKSYFKICHMLHCKLHVFLFAPRLSIAWLLSTPSYTCTLYFHCMSSLLGFIKGELNDSSNLGCINVLQLKKKHACKLLISSLRINLLFSSGLVFMATESPKMLVYFIPVSTIIVCAQCTLHVI